MSSDAPVKRKRHTWWEMAAILTVVAVLSTIFLSFVFQGRESSRRFSCQNNLKQWGVIFKMYSSENNGYYPRCATKNERTNTSSPGHGILPVPFGPSVYPDFLSDLNLYFCSSSDLDVENLTSCPGGKWCNIQTGRLDARNFNDSSFTYFGWMTTNESELAGLVACLLVEDRNRPANAPQTASEDFDLDELGETVTLQALLDTAAGAVSPAPSGLVGSAKVLRLKEGLERVFVTDINGVGSAKFAQAWVPVMWDRLSDGVRKPPHFPGGYNVLYWDGHVEFIKHPNKYPVSEVSAALCAAIN